MSTGPTSPDDHAVRVGDCPPGVLVPILGGMRAHALLPAMVLLVALLVTSPADSVAPVRCDGRAATIVGTDGPDRLEGTRGDDVIAALGGGDVVQGRGGDDVICGGDGTDRISGGGGDDRLFGQRDGRYPDSHCASGTYVPGDLIAPGAGDDYVDAGYDPAQEGPCGGQPDAVLFASAHRGIRARLGDPGLEGRVRGQGRDVVLGQRRLEIVATRFADRVVGGSGDDVILGHEGRDRLGGGPGDDVLEDGDQGSRPASGDRLDGGDGNDVVTSDHGQDLVVSGAGDDQLRAGADCPRVDGGPGVDRLRLGGHELVPGEAERIVVDAAAGRVAVLPAEPFCGSLVALEGYDLDASGAPVEMRGTDGPDDVTAYGSAGLTASLHDGDDHVVGTDADDVVDAGGGEDTVDGGLGLDACLQTEVAVSCEYSTWPPPPPSCDGRPVTILAPPTGGEILGTPGDDVILGSDVSDIIDGLAGDDVICARAGADTVTGGPGNDRLFGGDDLDEGDNFLRGDVMVPGPGDDLVDAGLDPRRTLPDWVGGARPDVVDYSTSAVGIVADLTPVGGVFTVTGEGTDTVVAPAVSSPALLEVRGSPFSDNITGGPGDDKITGMAGDDTIDGAAGDDTLFGENDCVEAPCGFGPLDHDTLLRWRGRRRADRLPRP